ncbi:3-oxo-5-alpha-steroid 4-dehydrogenase 1-like [Zingiber officinale]|uniref:3-oxo-5-alpha-steroid 4-dehydrogenase C-terminal domain-containing protein n=1 Tax=Zingiber officinale TaxID=94328 RepID=A0A8J5GIS7_ZINOF|nr:3-oxo-5-alpha-steroid 4-dehydrogenase 1-like [Zingiber officinale]KAG6507342.1 hypothetical protein ZIOFF_032684 [Zingiber officinale]
MLSAITALGLFYPPPPSIFLTAMSAITCTSLAFIGVSEVRGKHLSYSKFWNANKPGGGGADPVRISSRAGMLFFYTPALLASAAAFAVPSLMADERGLLVALALLLHFLKRDFEVLFVHQFSGAIVLDSAISISFSYFINTVCILYAQYLAVGAPEPAVNLKYPGAVVFAVGMLGNLYHHILLSKLRKKGDKGYKIPEGGLFGLVICPHYLFEIIIWVGVALMAQTLNAASFMLGSAFYLMGRSWATKRWYVSKFESFPKGIKALLPYIY